METMIPLVKGVLITVILATCTDLKPRDVQWWIAAFSGAIIVNI